MIHLIQKYLSKIFILKPTKIRFLILLVSLMGLSLSSHGARVSKVKASKVLILSDGDSLEVGALYYLITSGKKKGIVKLHKVQNGKALGQLLKGYAEPGWSLRKRPSKSGSSSVATSRSRTRPTKTSRNNYSKKPMDVNPYKSKKTREHKMSGGLWFGADYTISKTDVGTTTSNMSGLDYSFGAIFDYQVSERFWLRLHGGSLALTAEDEDGEKNLKCATQTQKCQIYIPYYHFGLYGRYSLSVEPANIWIGGGASMNLPYGEFKTKTNAIQTAKIQSIVMFHGAAGVDVPMNEKFYFPVWAEYVFVPGNSQPGSSISTSMMRGNIGVGMYF